MNITPKTFARRPWDSTEHNYIKHIDGVAVIDVSKAKGFYLCLHTSKAFLTDNQKACASESGWWWRGLVLENFGVENGVGCEGVYITDGVVPNVKIDVTIKNGLISHLDKDSIPVCLEFINFGTLTLDSVALDKVETPEINIKNCSLEALIVRKCKNFKIKATGSTVKNIKIIGCDGITVDGFDVPIVTSPTPTQITDGVIASIAVSVLINGITYKGVAENVTLHL